MKASEFDEPVKDIQGLHIVAATICDFLSFATHNRVHDYKPSEAYMVRGFSSEGTCRSRRSSSAKSEDDS